MAKHTVKLQEPKYVYMAGGLRPWAEATLHIGSEAITRGLNVFEGLKGYWEPDGPFRLVAPRRHYERLRRSARLLHIPCEVNYETFLNSMRLLTDQLLTPDRDMWFRTTLYVTEGHWGEGTIADLVTTAFHQEMSIPEPINIGVSTWRRSPDVSLPARIKTGTNYQVARLARIEGRNQGCQDMVLLNAEGRVAEATGSCIVMVRDGEVSTPPPGEGALESITVDVVESLARKMGVPFKRRPIDRTELLVADELALCGTLAELILIKAIEGRPLAAEAPVLSELQRRYFNVVRGQESHPEVELVELGTRDDRDPAAVEERGKASVMS
jgi:branched-chain amino acid aminotransferase